MIGELSQSQINQVLHSALIGRLAVVGEDGPYIVPMAFAFDGKHIYAHSQVGTKIKAMRKNPQVCFQVDQIDRLDAWRSVLIFGKYEELVKPGDLERAVALLSDRFEPLSVSDVVHQPSPTHKPPLVVEKKRRAIYFRIHIERKSGKYEK